MLAAGIVLTLLGLFVLYDAGRAPPGSLDRPGWMCTTGRVEYAWLQRSPPIRQFGSDTYHITYTYKVDSTMLRRSDVVAQHYEVLSDGRTRTLASLDSGDEVPVWYDPNFPEHATLMPDAVVGSILPQHIGWALLSLGLFILIGLRMAAS